MAMKKQISRKAHRSHKMMSRMPKRSVRSVIKRPARRPAAQQSRSVSRGSLPKISQFKRLRYAPFAVLMLLNVLVAQWHPGQTLAATNVPQSRPHTGVLAYATTMSVSELLTSTNQQRNANSVAGLSLNTRLNSAAQAKANDMVARDYWSHNTPDGQEPWVFFDAAGYTYHKAGENLAYGFSNAANTVTGWMNSPPHRENLLDPAFVDVGFGFANSPNFVGTGPETVVVAEYGEPRTVAAAPVAPTPPPSAPARVPSPVPVPAPAPLPANTSSQQDGSPADSASSSGNETANQKTAAPNSSQPTSTIPSTPVSRAEVLSGGRRWVIATASLTGVGVFALWVISHLRALKHYLLSGEKFILHHFSVDLTILSLGVLALLLSQSAAAIR
jgi:uncharacterized protein YkwD